MKPDEQNIPGLPHGWRIRRVEARESEHLDGGYSAIVADAYLERVSKPKRKMLKAREEGVSKRKKPQVSSS